MKLTDSQRALLEAAAKHPQKILCDFPANLKGGALIKVLNALGNSGLIAPHSKTSEGTTQFAITAAGREAIGAKPETQAKHHMVSRCLLGGCERAATAPAAAA